MRAAFKLLTQDGLMGDAAICIWIACGCRTAAIGVYKNGTCAQQKTHKQQDSNSTFCHCGISSWRAECPAYRTQGRFLFAHRQRVLRLLVCEECLFLFQFPKTEQK